MVDLVFRLDANNSVGAGHLKRSLALIEPLMERGVNIAVQGFISESFRSELDLLGIPLTQGSRIQDCKCLVIDHYGDLDNILLLVPATTKVVLFEDVQQRSSDRVDMVIDAFGLRDLYLPKFPNAKIFCGLQYQVFRSAIEVHKRDSFAAGDECVVTLGASSQHHLLTRILDVLQSVDSCLKVLVVSDDDIQVGSDTKVIPFSNDFLTRVMRAKFVVCAAGQTLLELVYCGVPVIGIEIAENQHNCAETLRSHGVSVLEAGEIESDLSALVNTKIANAGKFANIPQLGAGKRALVAEIEGFLI